MSTDEEYENDVVEINLECAECGIEYLFTRAVFWRRLVIVLFVASTILIMIEM